MKVVKIKGIESGGKGNRERVGRKMRWMAKRRKSAGKLVFNFLFKMVIFARSYAVG